MKYFLHTENRQFFYTLQMLRHMSWAQTLEQYEQVKKLKNCKDPVVVHKAMWDLGLIETDYQADGTVDFRAIHKKNRA